MSIALELATNTMTQIIESLALTEIHNANGEAFQTLTSEPFGDVGNVRVFTGDAISDMVYVGLTVAPIQLDTQMVFAFTKGQSAVPHFTLDAVAFPQVNAYHLDLIPRLDLGANLAYMNEVYEPLSATFDTTSKMDGLSPAHLSLIQRALMSPWMLSSRATEEAMQNLSQPIEAYLDHWLKLVQSGVESHASDEQMIARDAAHRSAIFNRDVDPVWSQIERLIGAEGSSSICELLRVGFKKS